MPLPALIGPILSALAWVGVDLGISALLGGGDKVELVAGMDFPTFISLYWPSIPILVSVIVLGLVIAFPKSNNVSANRVKRRN